MTETQKTCRFCLKPFVDYPMGEKNGHKFTACKACGSIETSPWPTQQVLDQFFADVQPEIVHFPQPALEIRRIKKLISKVTKSFLSGDFAGKRFLDVCSRQGYGVVAAKEMGCQARGIDAHDFFVAFAKDKYDAALYEKCTVQDYAAKNEQADLIYVSEGLCEQIDPETYVAALKKILAPKGKIYIQEPDGNHLRLPTNFANWPFVEPLLNFSYPSKKGLEVMLTRHGLKIEKSFFTWSPFMRLIVVHK